MKSGYFFKTILSTAITFFFFNCFSQHKNQNKNLVFVDKSGVLRYIKNKAEASFFGVNYTVPFAYGYRSVKRTGVTIEKEIDQDVYHLARLGLDAFRVHVWDWEISDSAGNLLENEHLQLFDYLISALEKRHIKILITPIAFWGNGYPEKDEQTRSFSNKYGKQNAVVDENAIQAQENYLKQLFKHTNPYTNLSYTADADVIATELNNEPHHSGPKEKTTEYINRLAAAVRSTGWTKPVFYNISESPAYADAVVRSNVDGHSFQWYPTGLVAGHTQQGNFLPAVDQYQIPFDTIPAFKNRAKMVYEFDAADVLQSYMYPAMARSFRSAGFQWATQFAYDPMATAYANTEYQTHYLNLAYTPSKAISLLIASKAFHKLTRNTLYGTFPADSAFDIFRVSYTNQLSEMNAPEEFYYSNSTLSKPIASASLKHIAGVGSSSIIQYKGYGAYFLDKITNGVWRLEVMPDAIHIKDPFEKASPRKEVTRIQWQSQPMKILLPDLGTSFSVSAVNEGNRYSTAAVANSFTISPGTYLLKSIEKASYLVDTAANIGALHINEFVAPKPFSNDVFVRHFPFTEISAATPFLIEATIVGLNAGDKISAEVHNSSGRWKTVEMKASDAYRFTAEVPAEIVLPGVINYRIIIQKKDGGFVVFPGNHTGNPYAWDEYENETWQTFVAAPNASLVLFDANNDRGALDIYNPSWKDNTITYPAAEKSGQLILKVAINNPAAKFFGFQQYVADKIKARGNEIATFDKIVIRAKTLESEPVKIKIAFLSKDGSAFSAVVAVSDQYKNIEIPFASLKQDSALLLPRPYPGFQPLMFRSSSTAGFNLNSIDKMQIIIEIAADEKRQLRSFELESVFLEKSR